MSYVYGTIIHVDIRDEKIWIQRDFTIPCFSPLENSRN
ncbi:element excision factor XisI family protein [Dolichospermum flos-aquae]|nr:element excision factor XisI family protein [Dolichospermum flos-aquae]